MSHDHIEPDVRYTDEKIRANRTFPKGNTVLLVIIVAVQIALIFWGINHQPQPQDVIHRYDVTVQPLEGGTLDIEYHLVWEALDADEPLTWVEIGMPNKNFTVYPQSVSSNIASYSKYTDEDYVSLRLDFANAYYGGDVFEFSFTVNQGDMLCKNESGFFYEFVPGWFNAIEVRQYEFRWRMDGADDYVLQGSLDCGEYAKMNIQYDDQKFENYQIVPYYPFDDSGAYNELREDKMTVLALCIVATLLLVIAEVYIIDSYVSYGRGRGFLSGYGYHVHTYGRSNPHYIRAWNRYNAQHGGRSGGHGGGCACACACACAGGGRAGCSQKDTHGTWRKQQ